MLLQFGQLLLIKFLNGLVAETLHKLFVHHQPIFCLGIATVDC